MSLESETVGLIAGYKSSGEVVYEEVPVEKISQQRYRVVLSPGFVCGIAADDIIELDTNRKGMFSVIKRSGNLCVQVFSDNYINHIDLEFTHQIEAIGGWLDGQGSELLVYTIPVSSGFKAIERIMSDIASKFSGTEWYYGNVYDPSDGITPLNWWVDRK